MSLGDLYQRRGCSSSLQSHSYGNTDRIQTKLDYVSRCHLPTLPSPLLIPAWPALPAAAAAAAHTHCLAVEPPCTRWRWRIWWVLLSCVHHHGYQYLVILSPQITNQTSPPRASPPATAPFCPLRSPLSPTAPVSYTGESGGPKLNWAILFEPRECYLLWVLTC